MINALFHIYSNTKGVLNYKIIMFPFFLFYACFYFFSFPKDTTKKSFVKCFIKSDYRCYWATNQY